jgi:Protein of unknown function (DUF1566)
VARSSGPSGETYQHRRDDLNPRPPDTAPGAAPLADRARASQNQGVIRKGATRPAVLLLGPIAWLGVAGEGGLLPTSCVASAECVAAACDPLCVDAGRYHVTEEVVDDASSHLLWQRRVDARLPWDEAVLYCQRLTLDGIGGWRLPAPTELSGIRYRPGGLFGEAATRHYCVPSIDQAAFPETPADPFWTSRRMPDDTAWYVDFADGRSHRDTRSDDLWVRCTHAPL